MQNALYGIIRAALLFYEKFVREITAIGFELNPYDPCVANKTVKGKQLTICWHVDDMKASHKYASVVTKLIKWLKKKFEQLFPDGSGGMKVCRGKIHEYLGMTLDFSTRGEVKVTMFPYVKEIVDLFTQYDNSDCTAKTSAGEHLFTVHDENNKLPEEQTAVFHHFVAKSLFATKRARPDISVPTAFLSTRVKAPDPDDWKKLTRMIRYLRGTLELPLILKADSATVGTQWWIDGSHAVHPNMRGHSGGCMTLGKGMPITGSSKQKLNTRSSTETEIVAVDDFMPQILWTNHFFGRPRLQDQDYIVPGQPELHLIGEERRQVKLETNQAHPLSILLYYRPRQGR